MAGESPSGRHQAEATGTMTAFVSEDDEHREASALYFPTYNEIVRAAEEERARAAGRPDTSSQVGLRSDPLQANDPWAGQTLPRAPYTNPRDFQMTYGPQRRPPTAFPVTVWSACQKCLANLT